MGRDGFAHLVRFQLEILVLENIVSAGIWHDIRNFGIIGLIPRVESAENLNVPVIVISRLVVEDERNAPALVDAVDIAVGGAVTAVNESAGFVAFGGGGVFDPARL